MNELIKMSNFELIMAGNRSQWVLRRALDEGSLARSEMLLRFETVNYGQGRSRPTTLA